MALQLGFTPTTENFVDLKTASEDKKVQKKKAVRQELDSVTSVRNIPFYAKQFLSLLLHME